MINDTERIILVAASDNHYAILLGALIKSVEINHLTDEKIDFYIIDDNISPENKSKIQASISGNSITLFWCSADSVIPTGVKIPTDRTAFPFTAYLRLFAPYIIPKNAKKMINLDVDMIVMSDISKLWNIEIGDYVLAAVQDIAETISSTWGGIPNYKELGMDASTKYFNSGLMMIDPIKWRAEDILTQVIDCTNANIKFVNYADQYGLNVVLANKWLELDRRWNSFTLSKIPDPFIIHFLDVKPIFKSYKGNREYKNEFFKYLELTPWKGYTPVNDYKRLLRKVLIKLSKMPVRITRFFE